MALHQILHIRGVVASHVMLAFAKTVVDAKQPTWDGSVGTGEGAALDVDEVVADAEEDGIGAAEDEEAELDELAAADEEEAEEEDAS